MVVWLALLGSVQERGRGFESGWPQKSRVVMKFVNIYDV